MSEVDLHSIALSNKEHPGPSSYQAASLLVRIIVFNPVGVIQVLYRAGLQQGSDYEPILVIKVNWRDSHNYGVKVSY